MYNAVTREVERELLPALKKLGVRFYAYNPLVRGVTGSRRCCAIAWRQIARLSPEAVGRAGCYYDKNHLGLVGWDTHRRTLKN